MTNPIGIGTVNRTTNMLLEEDHLYGRLACEMDVSKAALLRRLIFEGLKTLRPDVAAKVEAIRRHHREAGSAALLALLVFWTVFVGGDIRKAPRRGGRRHEQEQAA